MHFGDHVRGRSWSCKPHLRNEPCQRPRSGCSGSCRLTLGTMSEATVRIQWVMSASLLEPCQRPRSICSGSCPPHLRNHVRGHGQDAVGHVSLTLGTMSEATARTQWVMSWQTMIPTRALIHTSSVSCADGQPSIHEHRRESVFSTGEKMSC